MTTSLLPFDINNLAGAATRILYKPTDAVTPPANPAKIFDQIYPYAPAEGWLEVGATSGALQIARALTLGSYTIEQSETVLVEEPTDVEYSVTVPFAELRPSVLQIINESPTIDAVIGVTSTTGVTGSSAGSLVPFGSITDLSHYSIAFICMKSKSQGPVIETATSKTRGRFLVYCAYDCTMTAESATGSFAKGALSSMSITFKLNPDNTGTYDDTGTEYGFLFDETAGTIH